MGEYEQVKVGSYKSVHLWMQINLFLCIWSQQSVYISFHDEQCQTVKLLLKQIGQYTVDSIQPLKNFMLC